MSSELNDRLIDVAGRGDLDALRECIEKGADINTRDNLSPYKHTPLMMAVRSGHFDAAKFLINSKAGLNIQSTRGYTALIEAAWFGKRDIAKLLLDSGAEADLANDDGNTALMEAAIMGHDGIVMDLLSAGAHPDRMNKAGRTAMDLAKNDFIKGLINKRMSIIGRIKVSIKKISMGPGK